MADVFEINSRENAQVLIQALEAGQISDPEKVQLAIRSLQAYEQKMKAQQLSPAQTTPEPDLSPYSPEEIALFQQAAPLIATNPVGPEPSLPETRVPVAPRAGGGAFGIDAGEIGNLAAETTLSDDPRRLRAQARSQGIDVVTGTTGATLPRLRERFGLGLAERLKGAPYLQAATVERAARQRIRDAGVPYPEELPVAGVDPNTGQLMVLRPIGNAAVDENDRENAGKLRWTLVDPGGLDLGDLAQFLPNLGDMLAEGVGAGVGFAMFRNPALANLGAASAAGAIASLSAPAKAALLAKMTGITEEEAAAAADKDQRLMDAAWAFGGELGFGILTTGIAAARRSGRFVDAKDVPAITAKMDEIRAVYDELSAVTGVDLKPSSALVAAAGGVGSRTESGAEMAVRSRVAGQRLGAREAQKVAAENLTLRAKLAAGYTDITNRAVTGNDPALITESAKRNGVLAPEGTPAATLAQGQIARPVAITEEKLAEAGRAQQRALDEITQEVDNAFFAKAQNKTDEGLNQMRANRDVLWNEFEAYIESHGGLVVANGPSSPVRQALAEIGEEGRRMLMGTAAEGQDRFLADFASLSANRLEAGDMYRLMHELRIRQNATNGANVQRMMHAIEEQVGNPRNWRTVDMNGRMLMAPDKGAEALRLYGLAAKASDRFEELAEDNVVRALTQRNARDEFVNMPSTVRQEIFSRPESLRDVLEVVGHDVGVKAGLAQELQNMYVRHVFPDGQFSRTGHEQFMQRYGDQMGLVFGAENTAAIRNVETLAAETAKVKAKAGRVREAFRRNFGDIWKPGDELSFDNVINQAMGSASVSSKQLRNVMRVVENNDPSMARNLRAEMAQWMADQAINGAVLKGSSPFNRMLNKNEAKIGAVMGAEYVQNLKRVNRALEVIELGESAARVADPISDTPWRRMTHMLFGPLSRDARVLNSMNQFMRRHNARKALEIMSDPAKLQQFVTLGRFSPVSFATQTAIWNLGLDVVARQSGFPVLSQEEVKALGEQMAITPDTAEFNRLLEAAD